MVTCKFKCEMKTQTVMGFDIKLVPVTSGSPENEEFFKHTPYGELKIGLVKEVAAEKIKVGKEYYINISEGPLPDIDFLDKRNEDLQEINRALQLIRNNYEKKYGVRMFANGTEQKLDLQDDPSVKHFQIDPK